MDAKETLKDWSGPEEVIYMPKQTSVRLPVLAAAKIAALCGLYPRKSKSDIISDILQVGLNQIEKELPSEEKVVNTDQLKDRVYVEITGPLSDYHKKAKEFLDKLRDETGLDIPNHHFLTSYEDSFKDYFGDV